MKKFFAVLVTLLVAALMLNGNAFAKGKRVMDEEDQATSNVKFGFGLDGIDAPTSSIDAVSLRWDMGKFAIDGLVGFGSMSSSGVSSSSFGIGGQLGYVIKSYDNLNIKFLGRITFANYAPPAGSSSSLVGVGAGVGGEFFFPGIPNLGLEGGVLLNFESISNSGVNSTNIGIGPLNPAVTPGLAIHYYL